MANKDIPNGFKPYGKIKQVIQVEAGSATYPGDPVALASDGQVDPVAGGSDIYGVALTYAASAGTKVLISCDPEQIYEGKLTSNQIASIADVGLNIDHALGTPSTTYKASRAELSGSAAASSAGWKVIALAGGVDNAYGTDARLLVSINEHQFIGEDSSAGV